MAVSGELGSFLQQDEAMEKSPMQDFFAGKSIFLTGGTGFVGKVLMEKLMRTCPDIKNIYMLVRPKKGKEISERLEAIFKDALYDILREKNPMFSKCVVPVAGDVSIKGLGLDDAARELLIKNVQVVFHAAATVRFNEKMRLAYAINVQGTKDLLAICEKMKNLQSVVHVSTAYSNCNLSEIKEVFYQPPIRHEALKSCIDALEDNVLDAATPALLQDMPNTYVLTKNVSEDVVRELGKKLPIAIFRPSNILNTWKEPLSGWTDNMYGPTGLAFGAIVGAVRTLFTDEDKIIDTVPVDMTVSALIATAYDTAIKKRKSNEEIPIYNYVSMPEMPSTFKENLKYGLKYGIPSSKAVWYHTVTITKHRWLFLFYSFFLHTIPALLADGVLVATGRSPKVMKIYKKIQDISDIVSYFGLRQWTFHNDNIQQLWTTLDPRDQKIFSFSMKTMDWDNFFQISMPGLRIHLGKEDPSTIPAARRRWFRLWILHRFIQGVFLYIIFRIVWAQLSVFIP